MRIAKQCFPIEMMKMKLLNNSKRNYYLCIVKSFYFVLLGTNATITNRLLLEENNADADTNADIHEKSVQDSEVIQNHNLHHRHPDTNSPVSQR